MSSLAAELVRSLFCGLPRPEKRMAVFLAASDETAGADHRSLFFYCGLLAPVDHWGNIFSELWDIRVLAGPPRIPYLHMTEIRRRTWRDEYGLTPTEAERRVEEAFRVIDAIPSLTPISSSLNSGHLFDSVGERKLRIASGANKKLEPDYLAFVAYAFVVLSFCRAYRPEAEKVDFLVEKKGEITDHLREFYNEMPATLENLGEPHLINLLGDLIPAGKERVPLQAADVLCWHKRRAHDNNLDAIGAKRYETIARRDGFHFEWDASQIANLLSGTEGDNGLKESGISKVRSSDEGDPSSRSKSGESCDGSGEES